MTGPKVLLVAVVWVLTVAGASALTWNVISDAGARVRQPVVVAPPTPVPSATPSVTRPPVQSWSGRGGRLTAVCSGTAISLVTAVPDVGYWVKVYDNGPERLTVDFESTDSDDYGEVRVVATCVDGSPGFRSE